jgi:glycosyltransferase involved in cell wall biosynthesis
MNKNALLAVCLITYNHKKFIKQAIDSILTQETNFEWYLLIADDGSTDGTREILIQYQKENPDKIFLILQEKNIGPAKNWIDLVTKPQTKYIAYTEGDDYWTNNKKLQKQVDILEQKKDIAICFHKSNIVNETNLKEFNVEINYDSYPTVTTLLDLCANNYIHSGTVVYRNAINGILPTWFANAYPGDWPCHILHALTGDIYFINEPLCIYRIHNNANHSIKPLYETVYKSLPTYKIIEAYLIENNRLDAAIVFQKNYQKYLPLIHGIYNLDNLTRLKRTMIMLKSNSVKHKFFSWLPLLFGNFSKQIWSKLILINTHAIKK